MALTPAVIGELIGAIKWKIAKRMDAATWIKQGAPNGDVYSKAFTEDAPVSVEEDGLSYGAMKASVIECQAAAGSFFWEAGVLYVHTNLSVNPTTNCILLVYFIDRYSTHSPVVLDGRYHEPLLAIDSISEVVSATSGFHQGGTQQSFGSIKFMNGNGWFDSRLSTYIYEAKFLQIFACLKAPEITLESLLIGDFSVVWEGWSGDIKWSDSIVEVSTEDLRNALV